MDKRRIALGVLLAFPLTAFAADDWSQHDVYNAGDIVTHNGNTFVSAHWNQGNKPTVNDYSWDGWIYLDKTALAPYEHEKVYNGGTIVEYGGDVYLSKWWVQGDYPNTSNAWRLLENFTLDPSTPSDDTDPNVNPKSPETIKGIDSDGDGIRDSYKARVLDKYDSPEVVQLALSVSQEYNDLNALAFDDTLVLEPEEATVKLTNILAVEKCADILVEQGLISETPLQLYANTIYRALYYRLGKERLFAQSGSDLTTLRAEDQPCPENFVKETL